MIETDLAIALARRGFGGPFRAADLAPRRVRHGSRSAAALEPPPARLDRPAGDRGSARRSQQKSDLMRYVLQEIQAADRTLGLHRRGIRIAVNVGADDLGLGHPFRPPSGDRGRRGVTRGSDRRRKLDRPQGLGPRTRHSETLGGAHRHRQLRFAALDLHGAARSARGSDRAGAGSRPGRRAPADVAAGDAGGPGARPHARGGDRREGRERRRYGGLAPRPRLRRGPGPYFAPPMPIADLAVWMAERDRVKPLRNVA